MTTRIRNFFTGQQKKSAPTWVPGSVELEPSAELEASAELEPSSQEYEEVLHPDAVADAPISYPDLGQVEREACIGYLLERVGASQEDRAALLQHMRNERRSRKAWLEREVENELASEREEGQGKKPKRTRDRSLGSQVSPGDIEHPGPKSTKYLSTGHVTALHQRENRQRHESGSREAYPQEMKETSAATGPEISQQSDIPIASGAKVATSSASYFPLQQQILPQVRPPTYLSQGTPQQASANIDQDQTGSSAESMQTPPRLVAEPDEPANQADERQSRERDTVEPPPDQSANELHVSVGDDEPTTVTAHSCKPKARSTLDFKRVLQEIDSSDRPQLLKMNIAIELVGLMQEHKAQIRKENEDSKAGMQTEVDQWRMFFWEQRTNKTPELPEHPNLELIRKLQLLPEGPERGPMVELVIVELMKDSLTTNNARQKIKELEKQMEGRRISQARTLVENKGHRSSAHRRGQKGRMTNQKWESAVRWIGETLNSFSESNYRMIRARAGNVMDVDFYQPKVPQQPARQISFSGSAMVPPTGPSSTQALHSNLKIPGAEGKLRSSASAERVMRDEQTFSRFSAPPTPNAQAEGS